ncbi:alpha/beta hydrolase [Halobacillus andaensis]|uniref:alpha/beta hydrolase n=1 Tax=Halobacillus andaensis TaxID=1176239 RepID=UPI003D750360
MKKQVLFIHSAGPQEHNEGSSNLITCLQKSLPEKYKFSAPAMPQPENPNYQSWKDTVKKEFSEIEDEVILIGHSLGGSVLLKYLSEEPCGLSITGLFLLGSPYWGLDSNWQFEEFALSEDFATRLPRRLQIFLYHSLDDNVVPFSHFEHYVHKLPHAQTRRFDDYGHLFKKGLPELLFDIKSL